MTLARKLVLFGPLVILLIIAGMLIGGAPTGEVNLTVFIISALAGLALGAPLSIWITTLIARKDRGWPLANGEHEPRDLTRS